MQQSIPLYAAQHCSGRRPPNPLSQYACDAPVDHKPAAADGTHESYLRASSATERMTGAPCLLPRPYILIPFRSFVSCQMSAFNCGRGLVNPDPDCPFSKAFPRNTGRVLKTMVWVPASNHIGSLANAINTPQHVKEPFVCCVLSMDLYLNTLKTAGDCATAHQLAQWIPHYPQRCWKPAGRTMGPCYSP